MSQNARRVLDDCKLAAGELEHAIADSDLDLARIRWGTCLTLLRAVGHVLHKVDAKNHREVAESLFRNWKREKMFGEFIEQERNEILKQNLHRIELAEKGEKIYLDIGEGDRLLLDTKSGDALLVQDTWEEIEKASGYSLGGSPVMIVAEAIRWWEEKLAAYDAAIESA